MHQGDDMPGYPEIGDQFGHYVVRRRIGRGGMGTVFEAEQQGTGRRVALKVLSPELSDEEAFRDRFSQEAATLLALDSPHVIALYDYGDQDGALFIATQLVPGRDLSKLLEDGGALLTFSCSGGISADLFHKIVASAAIDAGVDGYITERLGGAPDHPMTLVFPEGEYLKGLVVVRKP